MQRADCFTQLSRKASAQWILEGDIKGCFDNISHSWLLDNIPMDKSMLRKWLKAGFMELGSFNPTNSGNSPRWDCLASAGKYGFGRTATPA